MVANGRLVFLATEPGEPTAARVERIQSIRLKQREVERIQSRLAREKQFNKRIAINAELRTLTNELKRLRPELDPASKEEN